MNARALASILVVAATTTACSGRLVAPLRSGPIVLAPDEPFRAKIPDASPVVPAVSLPFRVTTLRNGLHVVHLERRSLPIVAVRLVLERGKADAPRDPCELLARLSDAGTRRRNREALADLGAWSGDDGFEMAATVASRDLDAAVALIAESAMKPRFTEASFTEVYYAWVSDLVSSGRSNGTILERNTRAALFGPQHAYSGRPALGDIHVADLEAAHARLFQPAQATLVVIGDASADLVDAIATRRFGGWSATADSLPRSGAAPPVIAGPRVIHHARRGASQVDVAITARGPAAAHADVVVLSVLARMLGGDSSRLYREVTEDRGAAYSMWAGVTSLRLASFVEVTATMAGDKAVPTLQAMLAAIAEVRERGVRDHDLGRARASLLADWRAEVTSNRRLASLIGDTIARGQSLDDIAAYPARVAAVTREDVQRVARAYLSDEMLRVIVVGEPSLRGALARLGLGRPEERDHWGDAVQ